MSFINKEKIFCKVFDEIKTGEGGHHSEYNRALNWVATQIRKAKEIEIEKAEEIEIENEMILTPKSCPFCGGQIDIIITDEEGNIHDEEYAQNPYSGLCYEIEHTTTDNPCCPIARHKGESIGAYLYDTKEELIEAWNKRA